LLLRCWKIIAHLFVNEIHNINPIVLVVIAEVAYFLTEQIDFKFLVRTQLKVFQVLPFFLFLYHFIKVLELWIMQEMLNYLHAFFFWHSVDLSEKENQRFKTKQVTNGLPVIFYAVNQYSLEFCEVSAETALFKQLAWFELFLLVFTYYLLLNFVYLFVHLHDHVFYLLQSTLFTCLGVGYALPHHYKVGVKLHAFFLHVYQFKHVRYLLYALFTFVLGILTVGVGLFVV